MINMLSFAQVDSIETQKIQIASESDETAEPKDFAALLAAPVEVANNFAITNAETEKVPAEAALETNQIFSAPIIQKPANFDSRISLLEAPDFFGKTIEKNLSLKSLFSIRSKGLPGDDSIQSNEEISFNKPPEFVNDKAQEFVKTLLDSGKAEIVKEAQSSKLPAVYQNDFSETMLAPAEIKSQTTGVLPQLFRKISSVFKNEAAARAKQSDSSTGFISENKVSAEIQTIAKTETTSSENGSAFNFNQPETVETKGKKQIKQTKDFADFHFDKTLASASKEQKNVEAAHSPANIRPEKIFEQIEPRMMQLLALKNFENEKKVMKMRLHPAELGTVEIRLEKNASGALVAHFQTETEAAQQALNQNLEQLRDSLQNAGWQIERLEISCNQFSSTADGNRENASREFETIENRMKTQTVSDDFSDNKDDSINSNRLLSVRA